jgi:drug/metabolite transporter (DMT)-like permease
MAIQQKSPINGRAPSLLPLISSDKDNSSSSSSSSSDNLPPVAAIQEVELSRKGQAVVLPPQILPALRPRPKSKSAGQTTNMNMNRNQLQHPHRRFDDASSKSHSYTKSTRSITSMFRNKLSNNNNNNNKLPMDLIMAGMVWYLVGVLSIVTTKILLTVEAEEEEGYAVPPLVLTLQQLVLGSTLLRIYLGVTKGVQPLPKEDRVVVGSTNSNSNSNSNSMVSTLPPSMYYNLVLAGLFNALDFLASNTSFSHSAASFVETIKASEPITTTAIALFFGIDKLRFPEAVSLGVLVSGVLCSTFGNTTTTDTTTDTIGNEEEEPPNAHENIKTCMIVMTANVCFALRAKSQKLFRTQLQQQQQQQQPLQGKKQPQPQPSQQLNDTNLLMRMQQIGALSLILPVLIFESPGIVLRTLDTSFETHIRYTGLALLNATAFSSYCVASCYVLTKLSVMQYTGLGCLRRMFAILSTSLVFGVPITPVGALGIGMCFCGFCSFTHYRNSLPSIHLQTTTTTATTSSSTRSRSILKPSRSDDGLLPA